MTRKTTFLRGGLGSSSIIWGCHWVQTWNFTPVWKKGSKLKVRMFWGLIPPFVEVTVEKLVGGLFCHLATPLLQNNRVNIEFMNKLSKKGIYVDLKNVRILFIYLNSRFLSNYTLQFGKEWTNVGYYHISWIESFWFPF